VLLLITGSLLGLTFPLGKLANQAAISPIVWAWLIAIGSGMALSFVCRVRVPIRLGIAGIAIGFIGAVIVATTRGEVSQPAALIWIFAGLCIPLSLAVGNLYRTLAWPQGADPMVLAAGCNVAAAVILFVMMIATSQLTTIPDLLNIKWLALAQVIAASAMFSVFFKLQQVGGPTYLSQITYVAAGIALFAGTIFLGESYSVVTWLGAAVIAVGIAMGVIAQRRQSLAANIN
jgi:drug/metabolite transporter (DMT)-like permease